MSTDIASAGAYSQSAVEERAHTRVADCYQCGKCSAGCPVGHLMDVLPSQLVRWVQLGQVERAARTEAIWQCVSCQTCTTRCPKSVDCAGVMDGLRQLAFSQSSAAPSARRTVLFQKAFLQNIRRNGRLNELELIGLYKTEAFLGDLSLPLLLKDAFLAPRMMKRHKLHLLGEKVRDRGVVRRIFDRCQE